MSQRMGELDPSQAQRLLETNRVARVTCHGAAGASLFPVRYSVSDHDHVCVYISARECPACLALKTSIRLEVDEVEGPATWSTVIGWGFVEDTDVAGTCTIRLTALRGFYRGRAQSVD